VSFCKSQKNSLQYVLGICRAPGDAMGGAKNAAMMVSEERFQFARRIFHNSQGFCGCLHGTSFMSPVIKR
jgi:hypothetical protein